MPAPALRWVEVNGRSMSNAASTTVLTRSDGSLESPNTHRAQAPATMANGSRSMAHAGHWGQNAPESIPRRITADSAHVARWISSRRASRVRTLWRAKSDDSSGPSDDARSTVRQMAAVVSRSAMAGSLVYRVITGRCAPHEVGIPPCRTRAHEIDTAYRLLTIRSTARSAQPTPPRCHQLRRSPSTTRASRMVLAG